MQQSSSCPATLPSLDARTLRRHQPMIPLPRAAAARSAWDALLHTTGDFAPTIARVVLGAAILPHGAQKLFGWFGGYGFTGTMTWFTETMHMPWLLGLAAILAETLGGFALLAGLFTRVAAVAVGTVFVTAAVLVHAQHGFFINWFGNQKGEGIEYFVLGLALAAIAALSGGGALSVDRFLVGRTRASSARQSTLT